MSDSESEIRRLELALARLEQAVTQRLQAQDGQPSEAQAQTKAALDAAERQLEDVTRERDRLSAALTSARQQNATLEDTAKTISGGLDTAIGRLKVVLEGS